MGYLKFDRMHTNKQNLQSIDSSDDKKPYRMTKIIFLTKFIYNLAILQLTNHFTL